MTAITLVRLVTPSYDGSHWHMDIFCSSSEVCACNMLQVPETLALEGHNLLGFFNHWPQNRVRCPPCMLKLLGVRLFNMGSDT